MMSGRSIVVGNLTEYNASSRRERGSPYERELWRRGSDDLSDMAAFWGGDDKVVIAPSGIDHAWIDDLGRRLDWRIDVVEPRPHSGSVLDDLLLDDAAMRGLVSLLAGPVSVEPWGTTPGTIRLLAALRAHGIAATSVEPARERLWTVGYLDGKVALDDLAATCPDLTVPAYATAVDFEQLLGLVDVAIEQRRPFVVKSNVGVGGFGTFIADPDLIIRADEVRARLLEAIGEEPVFREGPFIVQDWIAADAGELRPTFDGEVRLDGSVRVVGVGGMIVDEAVYRGVAVGAIGLDDDVVTLAIRVGEQVGRRAAELGYAGWYDVDFIRHRDGTLYATEINARRTSPTHAFALLDRWGCGRHAGVRCVLTDDDVPLGHPVRGWTDISAAFADLGGGTVAVATICRRLSADPAHVGVAVGAPTLAAATAALERLRERLA